MKKSKNPMHCEIGELVLCRDTIDGEFLTYGIVLDFVKKDHFQYQNKCEKLRMIHLYLLNPEEDINSNYFVVHGIKRLS